MTTPDKPRQADDDLETGGLVIDVVRGVAYLRGELHDREKFNEVVDLTGSVPGIRRSPPSRSTSLSNSEIRRRASSFGR